jgi:hypothetical protein
MSRSILNFIARAILGTALFEARQCLIAGRAQKLRVSIHGEIDCEITYILVAFWRQPLSITALPRHSGCPLAKRVPQTRVLGRFRLFSGSTSSRWAASSNTFAILRARLSRRRLAPGSGSASQRKWPRPACSPQEVQRALHCLPIDPGSPHSRLCDTLGRLLPRGEGHLTLRPARLPCEVVRARLRQMYVGRGCPT